MAVETTDVDENDPFAIFRGEDGGEPPFDDAYDGDNTATSNTGQQFDDDLYKKWFRSKTQQGFLTVREWFEAGKVSVEIGELGDGGVRQATKVFTNAIPLAVYLRAVVDGRASNLYPRDPSPETYITYGGGKVDGKTVARVLKVHHWKSGQDRYDERAFAFKTGIFEGTEQATGAIMPNMKAPISQNMIKVSRLEVAELSYRLDLGLAKFTNAKDNAFLYLNGNNR